MGQQNAEVRKKADGVEINFVIFQNQLLHKTKRVATFCCNSLFLWAQLGLNQ